MNGLTLLIIIIGTVLFFGGIAVAARVMDHDKRREDRRATAARDTETVRLFQQMPREPEIAHEPPRPSIHELPPLGDAVWHQYPVTSPAAPPPPLADYTGAAPGTAAAAGEDRPPASPPPLPDPAWACANPLAYPLAWLESDTFVGGLTAIRDHGDTAGMEAEI